MTTPLEPPEWHRWESQVEDPTRTITVAINRMIHAAPSFKLDSYLRTRARDAGLDPELVAYEQTGNTFGGTQVEYRVTSVPK